ncbi:peptide ABC transporter substrate-binding protein [Luteimonas suaedae]|uniref:peptide ABC transporter substrate-binding protein n=1 Tax=Luteimonas suaedae TaxID=2605430 RepID=UPI0011ECF340|nr:peptide ABC transporter substrate-binding protein [Luteimonas suaedae]
MTIRESDWKVFKRLRAIALERLSQRILDECREICAREGATAHERYGELYGLIRERNREMAQAFDGFSRSDAVLQLRLIRAHDLLTEAEMAEFSEETRRMADVTI